MNNSGTSSVSPAPLAPPRASCGYGTAFDAWVKLTEDLAEQIRQFQLGKPSARAEAMRLAHALELLNKAEHIEIDTGSSNKT